MFQWCLHKYRACSQCRLIPVWESSAGFAEMERNLHTEIIAPTDAESAVNPLGNCGKTNQSAVMPTGFPRSSRAEISFAIFMLLMKR